VSPRTPTLPLDEKAMWRRLLARAHPDTGGTGDLFVWTGAVRDAVCGGELRVEPKRPETRHTPWTPPPPDDKPRIPYPTGLDFEQATRRALRVEGPYAAVLSLLAGCYPQPHLAHEETRGACYKRLAAIAHAHGMTPEERPRRSGAAGTGARRVSRSPTATPRTSSGG
jgi:hypothetical protein